MNNKKTKTSNSLTAAENNKNSFISRLMQAGWPKKEAIKEWEDIQKDEEGDL